VSTTQLNHNVIKGHSLRARWKGVFDRPSRLTIGYDSDCWDNSCDCGFPLP